MLITDIVDGRKKKIYLDEEYRFSLYTKDITALKLKVGGTLSDEDVDMILNKVVLKNALEDCYRMLARCDQVTKILMEKLSARGYTYEIIEQVVDILTEKGYINDYQYAENFVKDAVDRKTKGKAYIAMELMHRGIPRDDIDDLIEKHYHSDGLADAVRNRLRRFREPDGSVDEKNIRKVREYFLRRGFSYGETDSVLREILNEDD